jgi:hypothetical protein
MWRQRRRCFSVLLLNLWKYRFFLEIANGIHRFIASSLLCVNIFFVKALRQWRQIWEAMKRWNVKYGKKLEQWSDEAFNAGKEIEAMKRLTLHRIASSLHRFIAPGAQLCVHSTSYKKVCILIVYCKCKPSNGKNGLISEFHGTGTNTILPAVH